MNNDFIPIEVYANNKKSYWYMDVSSLTLGQLVELRKEIMGTKTIIFVDKIINDIIAEQNTYSENISKSTKLENKKIKGLRKKQNIKYRRRR